MDPYALADLWEDLKKEVSSVNDAAIQASLDYLNVLIKGSQIIEIEYRSLKVVGVRKLRPYVYERGESSTARDHVILERCLELKDLLLTLKSENLNREALYVNIKKSLEKLDLFISTMNLSSALKLTDPAGTDHLLESHNRFLVVAAIPIPPHCCRICRRKIVNCVKDHLLESHTFFAIIEDDIVFQCSLCAEQGLEYWKANGSGMFRHLQYHYLNKDGTSAFPCLSH